MYWPHSRYHSMRSFHKSWRWSKSVFMSVYVCSKPQHIAVIFFTSLSSARFAVIHCWFMGCIGIYIVIKSNKKQVTLPVYVFVRAVKSLFHIASVAPRENAVIIIIIRGRKYELDSRSRAVFSMCSYSVIIAAISINQFINQSNHKVKGKNMPAARSKWNGKAKEIGKQRKRSHGMPKQLWNKQPTLSLFTDVQH